MQKHGLHFISVGVFLVAFVRCPSDSEFTSRQEVEQTPAELEGFGYHVNIPVREGYTILCFHPTDLYVFPSAQDELKQK